MMFDAWALLVDVGLMSVLLMLGKLVRANVRFVQKLFIPPSLLAGLCALLLGSEVLDWLPFSSQTGTYPGILIALVFGSLPLTSQRKRQKGNDSIGRMWAASQTGMLWQWALGGALGIYVLCRFWPLGDAFGLSMPSGFCGGHGTAAAIGEAFDKYGYDQMRSFAMTAATVGIIAAVVVGMWLIQWGTHHGKTTFLKEYSKLPDELRTGIVPKERRDTLGKASFSAISLDSMTFNFGTVAAIALCGYGISRLISHFFPWLMLPVFSCAFLAGLIVSALFRRTKVSEYISPKTINHLSGAFTDYLVAFGVASIKLTVVAQYIVPIAILLGVGLIFTLLYVFWIGSRIHISYPFEKSIFTWGWFTGTMAMSIALLRIADPESRSGCLDDYAYAYIYIAPVEIALVSLSPILFYNGYGGVFIAVCAAAGAAIMIYAALRGWFKKTPRK